MLALVDGEPLLRRVVRAFLGAGLDEVIVVLGARADAIAPVLADLPVRTVLNPLWESGGMLSSVKAGLDALDPACRLVAVSPADLPALTAEDVWRVLSAASTVRTGGPGHGDSGPAAASAEPALLAVVPTCAGAATASPFSGARRGHPLVVARELLERVRGWEGDRRLSDLLREPDVEVLEVAGFGTSILRDVDVPADLVGPAAR